MKLFHSDPAKWAAAGAAIGLVLGALLAGAAVALTTILIFSFEKVPT